MMDENRLLISRLNDHINVLKRGKPWTFTSFLSLAEQSVLIQQLNKTHIRFILYGGYEDSERRIASLYSFEQPEDYCFPISMLSFEINSNISITHRDVLGSLMSLGIKRETIGDILFTDDLCIIICLSSIAEYIKQNLLTVRNSYIHIDYYTDKILFKRKFEEKMCIVPSMRADCVLSEAYNISRSKITEFFEHGAVFINGIQCLKRDKVLLLNDVVTLRHYGKFVLGSVDGKTKKDRIKLTILKYI